MHAGRKPGGLRVAPQSPHHGQVAQRKSVGAQAPKVGGSSPPLPTILLQSQTMPDILGCMDAGDLLKTMLPMAVTMNIMELKRRPWKEIQAFATEASQYIGEHGDNLLFKSKKKGETAMAFNIFAKGVAALSFAPGGVTTFGMHFESTHPEALSGGGRWLYHPVFAGDLPVISRDGLVPKEKGVSSATPKVFFTGILAEAARYAQWAFGESGFRTGDPVLLRVYSAHVGDVQQEETIRDDWYVERTVPAVFIQAWVPEKEAWIELREVVKQKYFPVQEHQYGSTPDDFSRYIDQTWPKV